MTSRLPTASSLERAILCPGSAVLRGFQRLSDAADRGTEKHRLLALLMEKGRDAALAAAGEHRAWLASVDTDSLPQGGLWQAEVTFAMDVTTGAARVLGVGLERDYAAAEDDEFVGTADVFGLDGTGCVVVIDYKTGRSHVTEPSRNGQLRFLALAAARHYKRDTAVIALATIGEDGYTHWQSAELDAFDLAVIHSELRTLYERLHREPVEVVEGLHCQWCPAMASCPAKMGLIREALSLADIPASELVPVSPEAAGIAWGRLVALEALTRKVRGALESYAEQQPFPLPDGRTVQARETRREYLRGDAVWDVLEREYGLATAQAVVEVRQSATKTRLTQVMRAYAEREGMDPKTVAAEALAKVRDAGAVKVERSTKVEAK